MSRFLWKTVQSRFLSFLFFSFFSSFFSFSPDPNIFPIFIRNSLTRKLLLLNKKSMQPLEKRFDRKKSNRHRSNRCFRFVDRVTINSSSLAHPMPTIFLLSSDTFKVRIITQSNHLNSLIYIYLQIYLRNEYRLLTDLSTYPVVRYAQLIIRATR